MELGLIKSREELVKYFANKRLNSGAEIGVNYGLFSRYMLDNIPDLKLISIDPWFLNRPDAQKSKKFAFKLLKNYENCRIIEKTSMEAVCCVPYESLDFVYIDGDHSFDAVICDLVEWTKRVRKGGIVSGHDYIQKYRGLRTAVNTYTMFHKIKLYTTEPKRRGADKYISYYFKK